MKKPIETNHSKPETEDTTTKPEAEESSAQPTEEEKKKIQKEMQKQFNKVKKKLKLRSKSELVAMIWEQGMAYRELQNIAQELYEENKALKEAKND